MGLLRGRAVAGSGRLAGRPCAPKPRAAAGASGGSSMMGSSSGSSM